MRYLFLMFVIFVLAAPLDAEAKTVHTSYFSLEIPDKFVHIEGGIHEESGEDAERIIAVTKGDPLENDDTARMTPRNSTVLIIEYGLLETDQQFFDTLEDAKQEGV